MHNVATTLTLADDAGELRLAHNNALAEIDYLNLFLEQRVTEYVRRSEKAASDMLKALA